MITNNFVQREVRTAAYDEQQTHLRSIVVDLDHGVLPMNFNDHYLAYILLDLFDKYQLNCL
jgi:hypothetical protein